MNINPKKVIERLAVHNADVSVMAAEAQALVETLCDELKATKAALQEALAGKIAAEEKVAEIGKQLKSLQDVARGIYAE